VELYFHSPVCLNDVVVSGIQSVSQSVRVTR
jgi:hypothetical protein